MLQAYHLRFKVEVLTTITLGEHCGAALRGMLFHPLWKQYCENQTANTCVGCPRLAVCPVSAFLSPTQLERPRGRDLPRAYIIAPPAQQARRYLPGHILQFGLTLFGNIVQFFPYLALSLKDMEAHGLGQKYHGQRGRFKVKQIESYHPLTGERRVIYEANTQRFLPPTLAVTTTDIQRRAATLSDDLLTLNFLTPTQIFDQDAPDPQASFKAIIKRLFERLTSLQEEYGSGTKEEKLLSLGKEEFATLAENITCQHDQRQWNEVYSYSFRTKQKSNISGFVGPATFVGDLSHFRELLAWGEIVRVGKGAVKGNGWYKIEV
jgi:hypothetical protein